ncbi:MAG: DNA-binding domain-containing protein, partial [Gammaproteobacteria bacterium]|nr:DNA-binding domain-containing protein [Gammaproteobacteria bacterium]
MSSLRELQSQFSNAIISGTADDIYFSLFGAKEHVAVRLNVYRNNIFLGQRLALTATFPVIQRLLGEHCFNAVATAYLKEVGATSGDLNDVGADFPDYIRNHPSTATLVYLYDVAQLEWRYQRCLLAADAGALTAEALAAVASESYDALRFETHPAAILFTSNYPVLHIWLANQQ